MGNSYTQKDFKDLCDIIYKDLETQDRSYAKIVYYESMKDFFYDVGILYNPNKTIKKHIKSYSSVLYEIMYKIKLEDVPLYINSTTILAKQVVKWRLKIGK